MFVTVLFCGSHLIINNTSGSPAQPYACVRLAHGLITFTGKDVHESRHRGLLHETLGVLSHVL